MKDKKELTEVRFDATDLMLRDNLVHGAILPQKIAELTRNIIFESNVLVEGAVYAHRIEVRQGDVEVRGAVFAQSELYVAGDCTGPVMFDKAVASANSVVSRAAGCELSFFSDVNAKSVTLRNAYVAGSIYADDVTLENCVVIGGVFATQDAVISNSIVGTFNSPRIKIEGIVQLLLPSAFSIEPIEAAPGARLYNLALADLGAMFRGAEQDPTSGRIPMDLRTDEVRSNLSDENMQRSVRSYTVVGKVLAADLIDTDRFQNHFLLTAAALGPQLLKTYDLGPDAKLDRNTLRNFFFDLMSGKTEPREIDARFSLSDIVNR